MVNNNKERKVKPFDPSTSCHKLPTTPYTRVGNPGKLAKGILSSKQVPVEINQDGDSHPKSSPLDPLQIEIPVGMDDFFSSLK